MHRLLLIFGITVTLAAQYQNNFKLTWIEPGSNVLLPATDTFENSNGTLGILNASGAVNTEGHPFFVPLGANGRACINCHQPTYAMSVSTASLQDRWRITDGRDPVFAAFDGSNCPGLPQDQKTSHSLLLNRGLFRIPLPWPPKNADGSPKPIEFRIEVVRDPTGCNISAEYGLKSAHPTISVYRRPRPAANLKYVVSGGRTIVLKTGMLADVDPETGKPVAMNLMSDAREATLKTQALSAIMGHEQARVAPTPHQLEKIVEYESQVYAAQVAHIWGGPLEVPGGPPALGSGRLTGPPPEHPGRERLRSGLRSLRRLEERERFLSCFGRPRRGYLYVPAVLAAGQRAYKLGGLGQPGEAHLHHLS